VQLNVNQLNKKAEVNALAKALTFRYIAALAMTALATSILNQKITLRLTRR